MPDIHYALDIGTRSVTGLVYSFFEDSCQLIAVHTMEHQKRAMQDGQIHDIEAVADVIIKVTQHLRSVTDQPLSHVSVAAAGRALRTVLAEATAPMLGSVFTAEDGYNLQLVALQQAQEALQTATHEEGTSTRSMHCVGYSVRDYFLDNAKIGSLIEQTGDLAKVTIIATFLPRVVIDSLDRALTKAGLMMHGLTLEPIAALNALIPSSMRKLNIALVDIGAGTSDIAITAEGTILAYGMVPTAGDEITDALSQAFLLDFSTAEFVKRELALKGKQTFIDILGNKHTLTAKRIVTAIQPAITALAETIAQEILTQNNQKTPAAVMVIGGGAKTPLIEQAIAQALGLTTDRVRLRGRDSIQHVTGCEDMLTGPEAITPIGIALASSFSEITPVTVRVRGTSTRLFTFHPLTIGDALLEAGVSVKDLMARAGSAIVVEVNQKIVSLKGTLGTPGYVLKNGQVADLAQRIEPADVLEVIPAVHGHDAQGTLGDIVSSMQPIAVTINDQSYLIEPQWLIRGQKAYATTVVHDRDVIIQEDMRLIDILQKYSPTPLDERCNVTVNQKEIQLVHPCVVIAPQMDLTTPIYNGLSIHMTSVEKKPFLVVDALLVAGITLYPGMQIRLNDQTLILAEKTRIIKNGQPCLATDLVRDGDRLDCVETSAAQEHVTMSTVLLYLDQNMLQQASGKDQLIMRKNGADADFSSLIKDGDRVEVFWQESTAR